MIPTPRSMASYDVCTGFCPCCPDAAKASTVYLDSNLTLAASKFSTPAFATKKFSIQSLAARMSGKQKTVAEKKIKAAPMLNRWKSDGSLLKRLSVKKDARNVRGSSLYDVANDDFHKTLLDDAVKSYSLQEFYEEKYADDEVTWDDLAGLAADRGWKFPELAIYMYTTESPNVYRPMNFMLRQATSLDDVDEYWQSYIEILKKGLTNFAPFIDTPTWRGVSDCSAADVMIDGDVGVMPSFTSTSLNEDVATGFANGCTVLQFNGGGFDISSYSDFPGEAELLVEEGREYTIDNVDTSGGYTLIDLQAPEELITPQVSGDVADEPQEDVCGAYDDDLITEFCPICQCCDGAHDTIPEAALAQSPLQVQQPMLVFASSLPVRQPPQCCFPSFAHVSMGQQKKGSQTTRHF